MVGVETHGLEERVDDVGDEGGIDGRVEVVHEHGVPADDRAAGDLDVRAGGVLGHGLGDGGELPDEEVAAVRCALGGEGAVRGLDEAQAGEDPRLVAVPADDGDERAEAVGEDEELVANAGVGAGAVGEEEREHGERGEDLLVYVREVLEHRWHIRAREQGQTCGGGMAASV